MPKINPSGPAATGAANIITIGTPLVIALGGTALLALIASLWQTARDALFSSAGAVFAVVWFLLLSTGTAFLMLRALSRPREVVAIWDCAHCITIEGMSVVYDKNSDESALQLVINFRNVGNGPIKLTVEEFRVVMGDRTVPELARSEIIIPRVSPKGIMSGVFKKDALQAGGKENNAVTSLIMRYGRHDGDYSRRYRLSINVIIKLMDDGTMGVANGINSETDEDI